MITSGDGFDIRRQFIYGKSYDPDAQAFFNRTPTQYNTTHKQAISDFIAGIKSDNGVSHLSDICDVMYFLGSPTSDNSVLNVVSSSFTALPVNSPTFVSNQGYTSNGLTSYINTQYDASSMMNAVSINDFGLYIFLRTDVSEITNECGISDGGGNFLLFTPRITSTFAYINSNITTGSCGTTITTLGLFSGIRKISTNQEAWQNGIKVGQDNTASSGIPTGNIYLLCRSNSGIASSFSTKQQAFFAIIKGSIGQAQFNIRFQTLKTAFGW